MSDRNLKDAAARFNNNFDHFLDYQNGTEQTRNADKNRMYNELTALRANRDLLRNACYTDITQKRDTFLQWFKDNGGLTDTWLQNFSYSGWRKMINKDIRVSIETGKTIKEALRTNTFPTGLKDEENRPLNDMSQLLQNYEKKVDRTVELGGMLLDHIDPRVGNFVRFLLERVDKARNQGLRGVDDMIEYEGGMGIDLGKKATEDIKDDIKRGCKVHHDNIVNAMMRFGPNVPYDRAQAIKYLKEVGVGAAKFIKSQIVDQGLESETPPELD